MSFELACCLLATAAALFYIFYLPGKLFLGRRKLAPDIFASAKTPSTKICATSTSNTSRQAPRRRLPVAEGKSPGRSRDSASRNRTPRCQSGDFPQIAPMRRSSMKGLISCSPLSS